MFAKISVINEFYLEQGFIFNYANWIVKYLLQFVQLQAYSESETLGSFDSGIGAVNKLPTDLISGVVRRQHSNLFAFFQCEFVAGWPTDAFCYSVEWGLLLIPLLF